MSAAHTSKIRIYDLAKELKMESKRLIEEVRREGVDVSVPSNTISKELAEKIRNKYFPKKEPAVHRAIRVVKKAKHSEADDAHGARGAHFLFGEILVANLLGQLFGDGVRGDAHVDALAAHVFEDALRLLLEFFGEIVDTDLGMVDGHALLLRRF